MENRDSALVGEVRFCLLTLRFPNDNIRVMRKIHQTARFLYFREVFFDITPLFLSLDLKWEGEYT